MGTSGVSKIINGPIPYAPDGLPLIGPMPGVPNAFEACVFHLWHRPRRWRRQGAGRMDRRRRDRVGYVVLSTRAASPASSVRTTRRQGHGSLRPRIRHALPPPLLARRARPTSVRTARRIKALGGQMGDYNGWERASLVRTGRRRHIAGSHRDMGTRRPVAAARRRRSRRGARRRWRARSARFLPFSREGRRRVGMAADPRFRRHHQAGPDWPAVLRRCERPHGDGNVDHPFRRRRLHADHRSLRRVARQGLAGTTHAQGRCLYADRPDRRARDADRCRSERAARSWLV